MKTGTTLPFPSSVDAGVASPVKNNASRLGVEKSDDHGGGITLPDNIEELIEEYLRRAAARLFLAAPEAEYLRVDVGFVKAYSEAFKLQATVSSDVTGAVPTTFVDGFPAEAIDQHVKKIADHDPAKIKREQAAKLIAEAEALEAGRGEA